MKRHGRKAISTRKAIRQVTAALRELAPPEDGLKVRVHISRAVPSDRMGDCAKHKDYYLIRLCATVVETQPDAVWMLLAHEWAHALTWNHSCKMHGDTWGIALAKVWRIITGEIE
jgi:predicted metal-dependent hydrolase